jgi:hypothetical protein
LESVRDRVGAVSSLNIAAKYLEPQPQLHDLERPFAARICIPLRDAAPNYLIKLV